MKGTLTLKSLYTSQKSKLLLDLNVDLQPILLNIVLPLYVQYNSCSREFLLVKHVQ